MALAAVLGSQRSSSSKDIVEGGESLFLARLNRKTFEKLIRSSCISAASSTKVSSFRNRSSHQRFLGWSKYCWQTGRPIFVMECHMRQEERHLFVVYVLCFASKADRVRISCCRPLFVRSLGHVSFGPSSGAKTHTSKSFLNVDHLSGRSFHEATASTPRPFPARLARHDSCLLQIALVASDDHDRRYPPTFSPLAPYTVTFLP